MLMFYCLDHAGVRLRSSWVAEVTKQHQVISHNRAGCELQSMISHDLGNTRNMAQQLYAQLGKPDTASQATA